MRVLSAVRDHRYNFPVFLDFLSSRFSLIAFSSQKSQKDSIIDLTKRGRKNNVLCFLRYLL